jgi:hypothetical protein
MSLPMRRPITSSSVKGLASKLLDEYDAIVEHARAFSSSGAPVELGGKYAVRCFQMRRFRYSIFAAIVADQLVVFSVSPRRLNGKIRSS